MIFGGWRHLVLIFICDYVVIQSAQSLHSDFLGRVFGLRGVMRVGEIGSRISSVGRALA